MNNKKHEICNKINKHNSSKYNIINENESKNRKLPNKDNNSEYIIIYDETNNKCKKSGKKLLKLYKLDIIQRRTSKSLLRVKYRNDKIQLIFFLIGILGLPIIPWILGWIIGKIILKPKSHKGKKLRQLNGTLTILCIIITSLFSIVYKQSLVSSEYSASTLFIDEANIEENKLKESINENKQQSKQILSCSSDIDIELIYLKQKAGIEKGLVLFIGKLLIDTWYNSKVLESAYENEFTIAAINPPEYGKSSKIIGSNNVTNSSYLYWLISSCLKSDTKKTVIVTHSNSITQKYVIPLIMNYKVSGIVFFNTNMGIKWFNAKNPLINDHYYYQPINMNNTIIRYIGDKKPVLYDFTKSSEINNSNISKNIKNNNFNTKKKINQQIITTTTKTTTKTTTITTTLEQISNTLENSEENLSNYETKEIMEYEEISNNDDVITDESQVNDQLHSGSGDLLNELSNSLISNIVNNNNQDTGEGSKNENTEITNNNNNNLSNKQTSINTSTVNSADLNNNESELYTSITTNNTVVTNKVTNTTKKTSVTTNTTKNTGVTTKATNTTNKTSVTTNTTKNTGVTTKATNTTNKA
ncbi:hypothetical protein FG379_001666, partial [Cryptosporidium bovis]|uniref:uncharacterized protein n=1 Tax=Cryptosporidium bovis TaxID=310047 RepID=UPI00351A1F94